MSGMEGYFGPRDQSRNVAYGYDEWDIVNQDLYCTRVSRPNNIELSVNAPRQKVQIVNSPDDDVVTYVRTGLALGTLITEHLLSHPFVVLRRQCQVNHNSQKYHIVPVTLVPVVIHLHQQQGITTLWKGLGSVLLVRGMALAIEDIISKFTPLPKELGWHKQSLKSFGQHILLKCLTFTLITPFYSASLVETVQSDIASEKPGIFDVYREGVSRLLSWNYPKKGRMLPVWSLVIPTVMYGVLKHLFHNVVKSVTADIMELQQRQEHEKQGALPKEWSNNNAQDIEVSSQLISLILSDFMFYPLETILHRLHLQGTRTIIDNLDNGLSVIPILTSYEGTLDCYRTTVAQESWLGLYKGFGAVLLQFTAYTAVLKLTKFVLTHLSYILRSPPTAPPPPPTPTLTPLSHDPPAPHNPPMPSQPKNFQGSFRSPIR